MTVDIQKQTLRAELVALGVVAVLLPLIIMIRLLPALLAGLLVHELVHMMAAKWFKRKAWGRAKIWALVIILSIIVLGVAAAVLAVVLYLNSESGSLSALLLQLAEVFEHNVGEVFAQIRESLPESMRQGLPSQVSDFKAQIIVWLRTHASDLLTPGGVIVHAFITALVGMVIGALISLKETFGEDEPTFLVSAFIGRFQKLAEAFRRVVFAQVRISVLNTALTSIYLLVILRIFGVDLPLVKTMILVTFLAGLLPVVGNLISNAVIVLISLSHSWEAAVASLGFLVVIHKLEYFFNARIVGTQIKAAAFEILSAMLIMEAIFGITGVIAAPIFYAYFKSEFSHRGWI